MCNSHIETLFHISGGIADTPAMRNDTESRDLRRLLEEARISGPVVLPGDDGWDAARQAWNLAIDQTPRAVVFPRSRSDIEATVHVALRSGASVVAQGTGHSAAAYEALSDSILIRTTNMHGLTIDARGRCRVEPGVLWGEVAMAAGEQGLVGLGGSSPDVGVVGYTLGGGIGWLARPLGLASNSVRSVDIVTADGDPHRVDAENSPEVFWALRGGGGGLGVVTAMEFDLYPITTVTAGTLAWHADHAPHLLQAWVQWTAGLDHSITSIIRYLNLPDIDLVPEIFRGRRVMTLGLAGIGDPQEVLGQVERMRGVAPTVLDTVRPMSASELTRLHGDPEGPTAGLSHHTLLGRLDHDALGTLDAAVGSASGSPLISVEIRHLGGALATAPSGAGALSHIPAPYVLNAVGAVDGPSAHGETYDALTDLIEAMRPWAAGSYLNFAERPGEDSYDAATYRRLNEIKKRLDPTGLFQTRQGLRTSRPEAQGQMATATSS